MSEDTKKDKGLTRRDFLKATGGAAAVAGIAVGGIAGNSKESAREDRETLWPALNI